MKKSFQPYLIFLCIGILPLVFAILLYASQAEVFTPYFGELDPTIAMLLTLFLGIVFFHILFKRGWTCLPETGSLKKGLRYAGLAAGFSLPSITMDILGAFPEAINVSLPGSILFYPAIGFVAEVFFHLIPLTLLQGLTGIFKNTRVFRHAIWISICCTASLEPIFQGCIGVRNGLPVWSIAVLVFVLYAFNIYQLFLFRRFGFLVMYTSRLSYYLLWHIIWGALRIELLF